MATKPENTMLQRIMKYLKTRGTVIGEKTNNPYRAGVWDYYMEAPGAVAWLEGKYWNKQVEIGDLIPSSKILTRLTPKQLHWGVQRAENKIPLIILCGFPKARHVVLFPDIRDLRSPEYSKRMLEVGPTDFAALTVEEYMKAITWLRTSTVH